MRKVIKEYRKLTASGADAAKLGLALREAQQILGKMAKVGLVKRGKARRLTSRLARKIPRG
jgi:ribosomal protein S20